MKLTDRQKHTLEVIRQGKHGFPYSLQSLSMRWDVSQEFITLALRNKWITTQSIGNANGTWLTESGLQLLEQQTDET